MGDMFKGTSLAPPLLYQLHFCSIDASPKDLESCSPQRRDPDLPALSIGQTSPEHSKHGSELGLQAVGDGVEEGEEDKDSDFSVGGCWGGGELVEEGEEFGPLRRLHLELDGSDAGDEPRGRVSDESTG